MKNPYNPKKDLFGKRKNLRKYVDIEGLYFSGINWYPCKIQDLTIHGAGLKLNQFFIKGDIIKLKITSAGRTEIITSTVANVNGQRIGIKFDDRIETIDFLHDVIDTY